MNETTRIEKWAANGRKLTEKNNRYDLECSDMGAIMNQFPLFAAIDPEALWDLIAQVYDAGLYRGHNMGKREAAKNARG